MFLGFDNKLKATAVNLIVVDKTGKKNSKEGPLQI